MEEQGHIIEEIGQVNCIFFFEHGEDRRKVGDALDSGVVRVSIEVVMREYNAKPDVRLHFLDGHCELSGANAFAGDAFFPLLWGLEHTEELDGSFCYSNLFSLLMLIVMMRIEEHDLCILYCVFILSSGLGRLQSWVVEEDRGHEESQFLL
jgi:hypothetical protein